MGVSLEELFEINQGAIKSTKEGMVLKVHDMKGTVSRFGTHEECVAYNQAMQNVIDMLG